MTTDVSTDCSASLSAVGGSYGSVKSLYGEMSSMIDSSADDVPEQSEHLASEDAISIYQLQQHISVCGLDSVTSSQPMKLLTT